MKEERRIAMMEEIAQVLESGMGPVAALKVVAEKEPLLTPALAMALAEDAGQADVLEATKEFFGQDHDWLYEILAQVDNRAAGHILRNAASVARTFHQLMEERKGMLSMKKKLAEFLVCVLGLITAVLGEVASVIWAILPTQAPEVELPLAVMATAFAAILLDEADVSPAWILAFALSYLVGVLLAGLLLPV